MLNESSYEIRSSFAMEGSKRVLVKKVIFQSRGHGYPEDDAMPNFFPDSKCPIFGLSNDVSSLTISISDD